MQTTATPFIIAIDGPAASGKGTLAKSLASHYRLAHLDTGLLYRAVGLALLSPNASAVRLTIDELRQQLDPEQAAAVASQLRLEPLQDASFQQQLRAEDVGIAASLVAAMPAVRSALRQLQVDFSLNPPQQANNRWGAVIEGRDIGSVIAPQAQVKLFIIANAQVRAQRRFQQLQQLAQANSAANSAATAQPQPQLTLDRILADIHARDASDAVQMDASRAVAGKVLDNSQVTPAELAAQAIGFGDPHFRAWQGQPLDL